ncbi:MAG: hypothetical protein HYV09_00035 [Deltaproteobacteria bacterium]|nr:hypothetical protein [Deltaproteobacteria bacterium]
MIDAARRAHLTTFGNALAGYASTALRSAYVIAVADLFFVKHKTDFRTNPANMMTYQAVDALLGRSVVTLAELLKDEHRAWGYPVAIRRRDLGLHRNSISHPMTIDWSRQSMRDFVAAQRDWKEYRPALVWDVWASAAEELTKEGCDVRQPKVEPTAEMAPIVHLILDGSAGKEVSVPGPDAMLEYLHRSASKYELLLKKCCQRLDAAPPS